jgi:PqqD family protein of HPr-rel-A system
MAGPLYIAEPPATLRRVELDGLTAFFHSPSGMTHILAPPAPQILELLAAGPADAGELYAQLSARFEISGGVAELQSRLDELQAAGLVSHCASAVAGAQAEAALPHPPPAVARAA